MSRPDGLILVSGLARCGTSLLMQMLSAGGWPVFDPAESMWPAFEHPGNMGRGAIPLDASGLLKWLMPDVLPPPPRVRGSIFLSRNSKQQARSFMKLNAAMGISVKGARWREFAASLERDTPLALAALARSGPVFAATFEELVTGPAQLLGRMATWFDSPIDVPVAVAQLRPRPTGAACLPYLLEEQLAREQMSGAHVSEVIKAQGIE